MAPGSTQPLTEMSTGNLPEGKRRPARNTDNLTAICEQAVLKMWEPRRLTTLWAFTAYYRDSFTSFAIISHLRMNKTPALYRIKVPNFGCSKVSTILGIPN
jgi:hypothetical protein